MVVTTLMRWVRFGLLAFTLLCAPILAQAAPYAAIVMDARTGEILYSNNADTRLHPASLTKMMTLYLAFRAIERGEITLDTKITVSKNAAAQPPSRLGLKAGQKIALRYLIRAAAVKSANDAASAIGDGIAGSEEAWAERMTSMAKSLGMKNTTFKNANGLTRTGHLSTARDMTLLGRHLFYDFPQYYNIFSRRSADVGVGTVYSTNRKFLAAYEGADGIKTGYTSAAGFNLTASAKRGNKRIIATVFGGTSTAQRNAKMAELLDLGFGRAPGKVREQAPEAPQYLAEAPRDAPAPGHSAKTIRVTGAALVESPRPDSKPQMVDLPDTDTDAIMAAIALAQAPKPSDSAVVAAAVSDAQDAVASIADTPSDSGVLAPVAVAQAKGGLNVSPRPLKAPRRNDPVSEPEAPVAVAQAAAVPAPVIPAAKPTALQAAPTQTTAPQPETLALASAPAPAQTETAQEPLAAPAAGFVQSSKPQPETLLLASVGPTPAAPREDPVVIARASTSGGRHWGIKLGLHTSEYNAQRALVQTALMESNSLSEALRKVNRRPQGFEASFVGMTEDDAKLACRRIAARSNPCELIGP
ncbi:serine hydrolase [Albirhodobacter sp. R86504]|uniref:D-alanyl-D-alanine carboxypeptidase family protein n=1 Tax=Albirhodobacter sp. R86504 TaxID=3093848 RepID=UPI00366F9C67